MTIQPNCECRHLQLLNQKQLAVLTRKAIKCEVNTDPLDCRCMMLSLLTPIQLEALGHKIARVAYIKQRETDKAQAALFIYFVVVPIIVIIGLVFNYG